MIRIYRRYAETWRLPPTWEADPAFVKTTLTKIGFLPNGRFRLSELDKSPQAANFDAEEAAFDRVQSFIPDRAEKVGTAVFTSAQAGNYGDDYLVRAAVILAGATFPTTEVSGYAEIFVKNTGTELSATKAYKMTFAADAFPR